MLSRAIKTHRGDELEHLVVELKAPTVKLGSDELTQIEKYAFTVAADERFRGLNTRWSFWVLSNDLEQYVAHRARASHLPRGVVFQASEPAITIHAKTWSEVLQENKARLRFFQEKLEHTADRGTSLRYLQETYDAYLKGVL